MSKVNLKERHIPIEIYKRGKEASDSAKRKIRGGCEHCGKEKKSEIKMIGITSSSFLFESLGYL